MYGGGGSAPEPDPQIGQAALQSAQTGQDFLAFMRSQAEVTNGWAEQDRSRHQNTFLPLQDEYIAEAKKGPDYRGVQSDVQRAAADVSTSFSAAQEQQGRRLAAQGVDPSSGRSMETMNRSEMSEGLATAGARNSTRFNSRNAAEAESEMRKSNAINMGSGLGVNPATSMGLSNGAASAGFGGAMNGYGQQGQLLNTQYNQQMSSWEANQQASSDMWSGVGAVAGLGVSMMSSKDAKEAKAPARGSLAKLRDMPVEEWQYKDGIEDGGANRHVGPYAEDFQKATGTGDGTRIPLQDALGLTMGAVQEVADKVDALAGKSKTRRPAAKNAGGAPRGRGSLAELLAA